MDGRMDGRTDGPLPISEPLSKTPQTVLIWVNHAGRWLKKKSTIVTDRQTDKNLLSFALAFRRTDGLELTTGWKAKNWTQLSMKTIPLKLLLCVWAAVVSFGKRRKEVGKKGRDGGGGNSACNIHNITPRRLVLEDHVSIGTWSKLGGQVWDLTSNVIYHCRISQLQNYLTWYLTSHKNCIVKYIYFQHMSCKHVAIKQWKGASQRNALMTGLRESTLN